MVEMEGEGLNLLGCFVGLKESAFCFWEILSLGKDYRLPAGLYYGQENVSNFLQQLGLKFPSCWAEA